MSLLCIYPSFHAMYQKKKAPVKAKAKKPATVKRAVVMYQRPYVRGSGAYAVQRPLYRPTYVRGRGDYTSSTGYKIGSQLGGLLGYGAQHLVKYLTGFGDYAVKSNSIMGGIFDPPELHNDKNRTVCIRHREYICDITASSAFTLQSFDINPGLTNSFPWLSQVAEAFEEYRITGMVYEFKTLSADFINTTSAALGYVIMATQYNALAPNFPDKKTMENYDFANSSKPSESFVHPIECKRSLNPVSELYVRSGALPANSDQRLYDLGNFQIATGGNSGSGVLGELWVTFEIEFFKPKLVAAVGYELLSDHYTLNVTTLSGAANLGPTTSGQTPNAGSNLNTSINAAGKVLSWPTNISDGYYLVTYSVTGVSASLSAPVITGTNITFPALYTGSTTGNISNTGSTGTVFVMYFMCKITAQSASLAFGAAGTVPGTPTSADLQITQVNGGMT